jgi:hypothetical protein
MQHCCISRIPVGRLRDDDDEVVVDLGRLYSPKQIVGAFSEDEMRRPILYAVSFG